MPQKDQSAGRQRVSVANADVSDDGARVQFLYSHRIGSRDGQSVHIEEMVAALRLAGHDVLVVGPPFYERATFGDDSRLVLLLRQHAPKVMNELAELVYNIPAYVRLRRACIAFKPDIIYERYNLFCLAGTLLARQFGLPLYLEINAPLADERARFGGLRLIRLARKLERFTWRSARRVLAVTGVLKQMIAESGVPPHRIEVTQNGINLAQFAAIDHPQRTDDAVVLGFVGFVRRWHGLDTVIAQMAACRATPPVKLIIVGDGPARAELAAQVAALDLADRVEFTGIVDRSAIPSLVASFNIALQPRVVNYASPLKIFEYMAEGRAIVAPDQANIREILTHGETALLFSPDDQAAMWSAIERLHSDKALRQRLGAAAREALLRCDYTWSANANRVAAWAAEDLAQPGLAS